MFPYIRCSTTRSPEVPLRYGAPRSYHQVVTLDSNECPADPEEVAEKYTMGILSKEEEAMFEDHYVTCNRCATLLERTAAYVEAMRAAAKKVRSEP